MQVYLQPVYLTLCKCTYKIDLSSCELRKDCVKRASNRALMGSSESVDLATTEVTVTQHILLDWYLLFENQAYQ